MCVQTLSHAPTWSRDVATLLNAPTDHDWRLLSSRLGYSNDDIRHWSTQPDPCLSMLDEWFATQRTREATLGVLRQLEEMHRQDAALIVENALKQAGRNALFADPVTPLLSCVRSCDFHEWCLVL